MARENNGRPENGTAQTTSTTINSAFVDFTPEELDANTLGFDKDASTVTLSVSSTSCDKPIRRTANHVDPQETSVSDEEPRLSCYQTIFSWRAVVYLLLHLSLVTLNIPRTSVNMAIVCVNAKRTEAIRMMNTSGLLVDSDGVSSNENLRWSAHNGSQSLLENYEFIMNDINWDSSTIGLVLSGQLFLSSVGPILFDTIRQRVGGRLVVTFTLVCNVVLIVTSPTTARASPYLLLINQVLIGLSMDGVVPVIGAILPQWTPENQRLTATAIVFAGYNVGSILSSLVNGFLCSINIDNGWPFIFYVSGMILTISNVAWFFLMADSPEKHPFISEEEKIFIQSARPKSLNQAHSNKKSKRPPYLAIAKSVPVLAYIFVISCFLWTMSVAFVYIPIYLSSVHGLTAEETGVIFAIICCIRVAGSLSWTLIGNFLTNSGFLSQPTTRKTCICTGLGIASVNCLAVSFFDQDNSAVAIALLMVTMFFQAVCTSHLTTIPMEVAPRYAGTVMSWGMSVGLLVALSGPLAVANITPTNSYSEWRVVWYIMTAIFLTACLVFLIFGQAKIQPWAAMTPNNVEQNRDLEQQSTDISMVPVADFSQSDNNQGSKGHVTCLESIAQSSEFGNPRVNSGHCNRKSLNHVQLNPPDNQRHSMSRSKLERDNPAFENDIHPQHTERESRKDQEFQIQRTCSDSKFTRCLDLDEKDISTENSDGNKLRITPQHRTELGAPDKTEYTDNQNKIIPESNYHAFGLVKNMDHGGSTNSELPAQDKLRTAASMSTDNESSSVLEYTKL